MCCTVPQGIGDVTPHVDVSPTDGVNDSAVEAVTSDSALDQPIFSPKFIPSCPRLDIADNMPVSPGSSYRRSADNSPIKDVGFIRPGLMSGDKTPSIEAVFCGASPSM